jgi:hypothetical protein
MDFQPDGYCGLYCGACPKFLASKAGTEPNPCHGCKSDTVSGWCLTCNLKACARSKGLEYCSACAEYPCADLEAFKTSADYPYHSEVYEYMKIIAAEGNPAWLEKMKARWSCPSCGREAGWWDLACKTCGTKLNGYPEPG